ncbi:MAG: penicillin acylase family protein, partial [Deltaproteobacteria bacterium]|nr:penicillin acylase family protein [Deltaproteobacteria bacterium]
ELRAIGGGTPGTPGLGIGRTQHIAFAATNGYADVVDLYLETPDPAREGHYLEGEKSLPFESREEKIRVRDPAAPGGLREKILVVRSTRRGPILSDHGLATAENHLVSLRWSGAARSADELGSRELLLARSVDEARAAIAKQAVALTHIVADSQGNIARVASGWVPLRTRGDGSSPLPVLDSGDSWQGFIPGDEMPAVVNPARQWLGSANHRIVPADYPYAYSTHFSHSWRYRRLRELLDASNAASVQDHWEILQDAKNSMAARIAPLMLRALERDPAAAPLARILADWDGVDAADSAGAAVFQATYRHFARRTFEDDLGPALTTEYLDDPYYWHERLAQMLQGGAPGWFDDARTPEIETRDDLFRLAAGDARVELKEQLGDDPASWRWGDLHRTTFSSPLRSHPQASDCPNGGTHPARGSGETLHRSAYRASAPYATTFLSSMNFVADLADPDKVTAGIPGGVSGRCNSPHLKDQLTPWLAAEPGAWWFSDREIHRHAVSRTLLTPEAPKEQ